MDEAPEGLHTVPLHADAEFIGGTMYKFADKIVDGYFAVTDWISAHPHITLIALVVALVL